MVKFLKRQDVDMLSGPILSKILIFATPIVLTSILQTLYNTADTIIVGQFGGMEALAAVGSCSPIITVVVSVFVNIFIGTNILVARSKGAEDEQMLRKIVSTTYIIAIVMGITIMAIGEIFAEAFLKMTSCPDNIFDDAVKYMRIYFIGIPISMITNFSASVIRNAGDSSTPFVFLSIGGLSNVVFNIIFVLIFKDAVAAVAIATVISMTISGVLFFIHMCRLNNCCRLDPLKIDFNFSVLGQTLYLGIPAVLNSVTAGITNLIIQPVINSYGDVGISGSAASASIETYPHAFLVGFTTATITFLSQNVGAGKKERVGKILKVSYASIAVLMICCSAMILCFGEVLLNLYLPGETEAIAFARTRLVITMSAAVINGIQVVASGALQAYGYSMLQMFTNLFGFCAFRIIWMTLIYPLNPTPLMLWISIPISWVLTCVPIFIVVAVITHKYKRGTLLKRLYRKS